MPQVIITIAPNGQSRVTVNGVTGTGCKDLTRDIENALGKTTADKKTAEFHQQTSTTTKQELRLP